jgi:transposase
MKSLEKMFQYYIGIDVSKETIDVSVLSDKNKSAQHKQFANDSSGYKAMDKWLKKQPEFDYSLSLICMEHTGIYTRLLQKHLMDLGANVWIESSLQIKKSLGLQRGKNDKIDSMRIAE